MKHPREEAREQPLMLERVSQTYGSSLILDNVSLHIPRNEFVAIVGPSGSGKTTLLNLMAGSLKPSTGVVRCSGRARVVYQKNGLFPWLTVRDNILLGLRGEPAETRETQLHEILSFVGITRHQHHYPHQLSGGLRQLAELARALAGQSEILLLDEPFSALDYITRRRLRSELSRLLQQYPRTAVLVTHDLEEAAQLADRIVLLGGRPARIHREVRLRGCSPRDVSDPQVVTTVGDLSRELGLTMHDVQQEMDHETSAVV